MNLPTILYYKINSEGTGLSLAYDSITKEHNGSIKVRSKEGEGSKFIIQLPKIA
jgi:signal transduction histidine kinase